VNELDPILTAAVFFSAVGVNALGSLGIRRTGAGRATEAGLIDVATTALNAIGVIAFTRESVFYLAPECLGVFLGSWLAIKLDCRRTKVL
jgi:hypothetical protein